MEVTVTPKQGLDVPGDWRVLGIQKIWIVALGEDMLGVFFTADEAYAYVQWVKWRLEQEHEQQLELESPPGLR